MRNKFQPTELPIEKRYPKLIRDRIPELIEKDTGKAPKTRRARNTEEFSRFLFKKMIEESTELEYSLKHGNTKEELADVLELIEEILQVKGWSWKEVEELQKEKRHRKGGFKQRLLLLED